MEHFIEITNISGEKEFINTRYIVSISVWDRGCNMPLITQISLANNSFPKTYESYDDIVSKIVF